MRWKTEVEKDINGNYKVETGSEKQRSMKENNQPSVGSARHVGVAI